MAKQTKTNFEADDLKYMQQTGRGIMAPDGETQAKRDYPTLFKDGLVYYDGFSKAIKLTEKGKRPIMKQIKEFKNTDRFLSLTVYKFPLGNCGGVTDNNVTTIFMPCTEGPRTWESIKAFNEEHLVFTEEQRGPEYWALNPIFEPEGMIGPMAGGNLAHSSDSRCKRVYHIHDRFETQEHYNANWN